MGGDTTVEAPQPVNPAQVGADSLATQLRLAPDVYAGEAQYRPQYAALDQRILGDSLLGTNGAPGLLDLYGKAATQMGGQQIAANSQQREADIADVGRLGGQARDAYLSANPQLSRTMDSLENRIGQARNVTPGQVGPISATAARLQQATLARSGRLGRASTAQAFDASAGDIGQATMARSGNVGPASMMESFDAQAGNLGAANPYDAATFSATGVRDSALTPRLLDDAMNYGRKSDLQAELERQAGTDLANGGNLTASELAAAQQDVRGAYAARGLNDSNGAIGAEILATDAARTAKMDRARTFAAGTDASGQKQLQDGRGFAMGVEDSLLGRSQFNAASENAAAATNTGALNTARATNAGANNQFALSRFTTDADLAARNAAARTAASGTNAGAANQFALSQFNTDAEMARTNAGAANQFASQRYGTEADIAARNAAARTATSATNAGAANQFALQRYGTEADMSRTNAGAANQFALSQFTTDADLARSNATLDLQRQMANLDYTRASTNDQYGREFQLAGMLQGQAQDPFQMVLGRSGAVGQAQGAAGQAAYTQGAGAKLFDPFNSSLMQIYGGNQANELAARTATANNKSSQSGAIMGTVGTVAAAKLMMMCLPEGQTIDTPRGPMPVERIRAGHEVYGYSGAAVKVLHKHEYAESLNADRFLLVRFEVGGHGRFIKLCDRHRIQGKAAGGLQVGDLIGGRRITDIVRFGGVQRSYDLLTEDAGYQIHGVPVNSMIHEMALLAAKLATSN